MKQPQPEQVPPGRRVGLRANGPRGLDAAAERPRVAAPGTEAARATPRQQSPAQRRPQGTVGAQRVEQQVLAWPRPVAAGAAGPGLGQHPVEQLPAMEHPPGGLEAPPDLDLLVECFSGRVRLLRPRSQRRLRSHSVPPQAHPTRSSGSKVDGIASPRHRRRSLEGRTRACQAISRSVRPPRSTSSLSTPAKSSVGMSIFARSAREPSAAPRRTARSGGPGGARRRGGPCRGCRRRRGRRPGRSWRG
jgi:hypothetical protein